MHIPAIFRPRLGTLILACSCVFAPLARALDVPPGGVEMADATRMSAHVATAMGKAEKLPPVDGKPGGWRLTVRAPESGQAFDAQCSVPCPTGALAPGDKVLVIVKARVTGADPGSLTVKLQLADKPYTEACPATGIDIAGAWNEYPVLFEVVNAIPDGRASLTLFCGQVAQTVEVAGLRVLRYAPTTDVSKFPRIRRTYAGREADAPWRAAALARIERDRKQDLSVRLTGPDGKPLAGAPVKLTLRRHAFGFGSAVPASLMCQDSENGRNFRAIVDRLFSMVVFENDLKDFWWAAGQPAHEKAARRAELDQAMTWFADRHIAIRGHYLMQVATPSNLSRVTDIEAIRKHFLDTARDRIEFVNKRVCEWDVINHPIGWGGDMLSSRPGLESLDREVFRFARGLTDLPFYVNEDQIFRPGKQSEDTFHYLKKLKQDGFVVDGLGNQAHIHESFLPSPERIFAVTDRFATVVPRQIITEFDLQTNNDEQLAADYTRDLLIACFSHPAYTGFLWWGFWEGSHWMPDTASWKRDWTIKQRGEVMEEWLGRRWRTEVTLTTDAQGVVRWRGFPGWYDASPAAAAGKPAEFNASAGTTAAARLP